MDKNKKLICVYGSLRKGLHNHGIIENAELLGTFWSEPIYSLYSLGGFPGLKENGDTSVLMEVYSVNDIEAKRVDSLEGYSEDGNNWFYDKVSIETPYGTASVYIYVPSVDNRMKVESGDWKEYVNQKNLQYY